MRQVYLADILEEKGQEVKRYGLETETESSASLKEVLETADVIAAPVPFLKKDVVFCKNPQEKFQTELQRENILKLVRPGSVLFAGGIPAEYEKKAAKKGIVCVDYLKDEYTAMENTVAAAEGLLAEAICRSSRNLFGSSCLSGAGIWKMWKHTGILSEKIFLPCDSGRKGGKGQSQGRAFGRPGDSAL